MPSSHTRKSNIEKAKEHAAKTACSLITDNMIVGVGSGTTVFYFIKQISKMIKSNKLHRIQFVPTSFDTQQLLSENGMICTTLRETGVDIVVDGADEVSKSKMLIKGGGGAHLREKIVYRAAKTKVIIIDWNKQVQYLGSSHPVPVEIASFGWRNTKQKILELEDASYEIESVTLRRATSKLGPVVTDNNNFILDVKTQPLKKPIKLEKRLSSIPGVLITGLFTEKPDKVIVGAPTGSSYL